MSTNLTGSQHTDQSAHEVIYRPMQYSDLNAMVDCFNRVWPQGERVQQPSVGLLVSKYLTLHYLTLSTWANVAVLDDGTFAGVTLVRVAGDMPLFDQAAVDLEHTRQELLASPAGAQALSGIEDGFFMHEAILEEDSDIATTTQAELELFMVSPNAQGKGVGRTLWNDLYAALAEHNVHAFFLHTDSSCDYGFYDHKGLQKVAERLHADHPEDDDSVIGGITDDQFIYRGEVPPRN